jgi:hypothetical protein
MNLASGNTARLDCLGISFEDDNERRTYFRAKLREFLADPAFRAQDGFPVGSDDAIVEMSDPPYYTACPNPFIAEMLLQIGGGYDATQSYSRAPLAIDVSVGKMDPLYKAHGYHTKVPHQAIVPSILHYTEPGDVVLDAFCGSGMTGVAAQFCGSAPLDYRIALEQEWKEAGRLAPNWGARRAILNDLSPAATFIAANYTTPFDTEAFEKAAQDMLEAVRSDVGWMYETTAADGKTVGRIDYTIWSEVFSCSTCAAPIQFLAAERSEEEEGRAKLRCEKCGALARKEELALVTENFLDPATNTITWRPKREAVALVYRIGRKAIKKDLDSSDRDILRRIAEMPIPAEMPISALVASKASNEGRMRTTNVRHINHFFLPRSTQAMSSLWRHASQHRDERIRNMLLFAVEQAIWTMTVLNRYRPTGFSQFGQFLSGVFYVGSQHAECSPWYILEGKIGRIAKAFSAFQSVAGETFVTVGSASNLAIADNSVDYIFTDPPFGGNIYYADLNFLVESWHKVATKDVHEAVINPYGEKTLVSYQNMMRDCFSEYFRVLKPGRWMTVVFSNSKASVWNAIQVSLQQSGFVVAEVTALDKTQGSFQQVTSPNAIKQDLVVSCYKPNGGLEERLLTRGVTEDTAWDFVQTHLKNLAVTKVGRDGNLEVIAERDPRRIFDRMVAWFVRHNTPVPISNGEFQSGIIERFQEKDGMVFLPNQFDEYLRKRLTVGQAPQRALFVDDERSAIDWLSDFLRVKPSTYQDVHPEYTRQTTGAGWRKHEEKPELAALLEDNFLRFDGVGPVPPQIHQYLSSNWKDLRNLEKEDPALVSKARDRWYIPDPAKQEDVEKRREKALLKDFERYRSHTGRKLKEVRLEVLRAGFKAAWASREYQTIIDVADKIAEDIWQEDEKLLTFYDMAETRLRAGR